MSTTTLEYSLAAKFASEFVGMTLTIWMGESILANELLPATKGHAMGLLAVAIGFGLAFGVSIAWLGGISAHLNPAMLFFLAILGKLHDGWVEFVVLSCAELLGAFVGAVLVYLQFWTHFRTVPLPSDSLAEGPVAVLLHGFPDALGNNAARIASAFGPESQPPVGGITLRQELRNVLRRRSTATLHQKHSDQQREALLEKMEVRRQERTILKRAHSAQIAGLLHTHDPGLTFTRGRPGAEGGSGRGEDEEKKACHTFQSDSKLDNYTNDNANNADDEKEVEYDGSPPDNEASQQQHEQTDKPDKEVFHAALNADALAKLSIFATRPAKYYRPANFYQEMTGTAALTFGAEMFNLRREFDSSVNSDGAFTQALFVSLFITMLILGLGGTTGLAVNPARDAGPRLAHSLLPIPGKGSSEWHYAWVPILAPLVGAALGAGVFRGMELLFETGTVADTDGDVVV